MNNKNVASFPLKPIAFIYKKSESDEEFALSMFRDGLELPASHGECWLSIGPPLEMFGSEYESLFPENRIYYKVLDDLDDPEKGFVLISDGLVIERFKVFASKH